MIGEKPRQSGEEEPEKDSDTAEPILEQKPEYNFEEMSLIEPDISKLAELLKDKIESGEYSALLSDDGGGRIPTLVLRRIIKEKAKNKECRDIKTYFLGGGIFMPGRYEQTTGFIAEEINSQENYDKLSDYLKGMDFGNKKILIITEVIAGGDTLKAIGLALKNIGMNNFEFVSMGVHDKKELPDIKRKIKKLGSNLVIASKNSNFLSRAHEKLSGVESQIHPYSPYPKKVDNAYDIGKSREDVKLMAERIIEKVWGKEK